MAETPHKIEKKMPLPKRLMLLLTLIALTGIIVLQFQQGGLLSILLLLIILASLGRQKSGLIMLRLYSCIHLLFVSYLPIFIYQAGNTADMIHAFPLLQDWPNQFYILLWVGVSLLSILQVYLAFNLKISAYFKDKINLNIIS
ncbi:hypothetical protein [Shewanella surugensis]|uniref:Energy-coupling factor transporter transmembrane protein EcfT n=1 Tax=Shewanella surugensis TaxID=212020 RepID=A0ABT0L6L9_9GAMM|nr:hypothetical protein [Shewanella surugensis]MCL1123135.1 hypothetical protein [Shewanella surugensis]